MKATSHILKNKLKIILSEDNSNPLVSLQLFVRIGSAWEKKNEAGYSHFTEHLVFKSTKKFPQNSIMERITYLGGSINAYTEYDSTCFFVTMQSGFLEEGIEILSELVMHANYDVSAFEFEKNVVIEELKQFKNDPEDFFIDEIANEYFRKNPYKFPIIGNKNSLKDASLESLRLFYKNYYLPNNSFLVASGDLEEDNVLRLIEKYFGSWKQKGITKTDLIKDKLPAKPAVFSIEKKISNDMLAFILPDIAESNPDSYPISLAMKAFAIGKNSRLHSRLFDKEQLTDNIKVHSLCGINDGAAIILIMPKKKADLNKICEIFLEEQNNFVEYGLNETELKDHKKELIFFYRYSFEYVESLASSLGMEELQCKYERFFEYPERINKIKNSELNKIIKKYLCKDHLYIFHHGKRKFDKSVLLEKLNLPSKKTFKNIQAKEYYETHLQNGMKVLLKKVYGKPTVGISLSFEVSQLNETVKNRGLNLLTSGLMLYGNEKRNYQQVLNYCTSNGINLGIIPQLETTSVKMKCFKEMLPITIELLSEVVQTPVFPSGYFYNLQQTYKSNLDRIRDYPIFFATKLWKELIFGKYSNMINQTGTKSSLKCISLKKIRKWFRDYYHPQNMSLAIVGEFNFNQVIEICEQTFKSDNTQNTMIGQQFIYDPSSQKNKKTKKNIDQSIIHLGGFGCSFKEKEKNTAFHVLAQIIGGDTNSILFNELREKRGLAYSVEFDFHSYRELGYYVATAIVDKKREGEAIDIIRSVLDNIKKNGISKEDLQKTKNYIRGQRLMEEESMLSQAQMLSILEAIGFGYEYYRKREERLEKVSLKAIHNVAEEYFNEDEFFIHVLS